VNGDAYLERCSPVNGDAYLERCSPVNGDAYLERCSPVNGDGRARKSRDAAAGSPLSLDSTPVHCPS
jgi:hypothetical protein